MRFIGDFHIHSKYSRATSPKSDLEHLAEAAKIKGIKVLGSGDFTHPEWLKDLREKLEPAEVGLYELKTKNKGLKGDETRFILTSEISCIYSKLGKVRKVHIVIFAPSLEIVEKINSYLETIGNLKADGRPILGLDAKELTKIVLNISEDCLVVPAHIMTPWFSIFGSKSGFDSIEECFDDFSKYIYAVETGLSADPPMIWRLPDMDRITLISNSDAHSPAKIGREANIFEGKVLSYQSIIEAIKKGGRQTSCQTNEDFLRLVSTIEFYPQEGKYHYDGHRNCEVCFSPKESKKYNNICPVCGRPLTIGVLNRIEELADKPEGFEPKNKVPFISLVPLGEIIAEAIGKGDGTKAVSQEYQRLIKEFGNEFKILMDVSYQDLIAVIEPEIAEGIIRVREGKVFIHPGYDGVFGRVSLSSEEEKRNSSRQEQLF